MTACVETSLLLDVRSRRRVRLIAQIQTGWNNVGGFICCHGIEGDGAPDLVALNVDQFLVDCGVCIVSLLPIEDLIVGIAIGLDVNINLLA